MRGLPRSPRPARERQQRSDDYEAGGNFHMILLAMNMEGYRNLCKMVSLAYQEGFYFKPRIDKELLREFNGGLIATERLPLGRDQPRLRRRQLRERRELAIEYLKIFGDRYYLEIQDNHIPSRTSATRC
jgi:DNA polymerase-3 subunit alpha